MNTSPADNFATGNEAPSPADALLAARYVDGDLTGPDLAAFTARLSHEPALAAHVQQLLAADQSLRDVFTPPPAPEHTLTISHASSRPRRWQRVAALAAALALASLCVWLLTAPLRHPFARLYAREQADNFTPQTVCTTPQEFAAWTSAALQQSITPANLPANVQLIGWDYAPEMQYYTCVLIAKVSDQHILVTLDRLDKEQNTIPPRAHVGNLTIHERILGDLRLREITPLPAPQIVPFLELTEPPPADTSAAGSP